jgi:hypothetical protein
VDPLPEPDTENAMTNANESTLHLPAPRRHALKDLGVVAFLLLVLGAFVAQISSGPSGQPRAPEPGASARVHAAPRA